MSDQHDQPAPPAAPRSTQRDVADGLDHIREILLGDMLVELERRLGRLENLITNRANEVQHDVRHRTGLLEAHVRKELDAIGKRVKEDATERIDAARAQRAEERDALAKLDQRIAHLEGRVDSAIARVEHEMRDQLLAQAKSFIDELEGARIQLRSALNRELGIEGEQDEGDGHAGAWAASH
jgi:hypothetical protein